MRDSAFCAGGQRLRIDSAPIRLLVWSGAPAPTCLGALTAWRTRFMANRQNTQPDSEPQRIKLTARLSLQAYDAVSELQRQHRRQTGKALPLWRVLDAAIIAYAQAHGITRGE